MLIEKRLPLSLHELIDAGFAQFTGNAALKADPAGVAGFAIERVRGWLRERGYVPAVIDAVLAAQSDRFDELIKLLDAVNAFNALPEAEALAAANKRIGNILKKSAPAERAELDRGALHEPAERALDAAIHSAAQSFEAKLASQDYTGALRELAALHAPVDSFFDQVMVMADDAAVRANRVALLRSLHTLMNRIADLSRLAA